MANHDYRLKFLLLVILIIAGEFEVNGWAGFNDVFMISALTGNGIDLLKVIKKEFVDLLANF